MKVIPVKFRGVDLRNDKTVFGCDIRQYPHDIWIGDDNFIYPIKPESLALLTGYDDEGAEIYESLFRPIEN